MANAGMRFLLVQMADLGDLILTTPAMAALRTAYPSARIDLLANAKLTPVIEPGLIDEVIGLDLRGNRSVALFRPANVRRLWALRGQYDALILFHHFTLRAGLLKFWWMTRLIAAPIIAGLQNGRARFLTHSIPDEGFGARHEAAYWLALAGLFEADASPQRARVGFHNGVLPLVGTRARRVVIHAGSGGYSLARRWSPQAFAQLADALVESHEAQIVLVGTPQDDGAAVLEAMQSPAVDLTGRTSLTQLADILRSADVYIGADSGVLHMAAAVRAPVIAIYGPSNHRAWGPWSPGGRVVVVRSAPRCSPCSYVGGQIGLRDGCEARTCMRLVAPEQVVAIARDLLDDKSLARHQTNDPAFAPAHRDRLRVLGLPVDNITYRQWMRLVEGWVSQPDGILHHVCTINPEFVMIAQRDINFANILRRADLCIPDGVGLQWAARILGKRLKERVTGSDGTWVIAEHAAKHGWRLYLLGAGPGIAERAAHAMQARYPNLIIAGTYAGSPAPLEEDAIVARINAASADILLVAYGAPQQDKWIARNAPRLQVKMAMGIGGSLDFIAGVVPRAPQWMRDNGLEWLYRLYRQPWRIWRMLRLPQFVLAVLARGEN